MISDPLNPLWQEMSAATARLTLRQVEMLRGLGIPAVDLIAESMIGITAAEFDSRDFWTPIPTGKPMIVTPLEEDGKIADLIAFDPSNPDTWYLRTGTGWALGHDHLDEITRNIGWPEMQQWVDLHATPAGLAARWLHGCLRHAMERGIAHKAASSPAHPCRKQQIRARPQAGAYPPPAHP